MYGRAPRAGPGFLVREVRSRRILGGVAVLAPRGLPPVLVRRGRPRVGRVRLDPDPLRVGPVAPGPGGRALVCVRSHPRLRRPLDDRAGVPVRALVAPSGGRSAPRSPRGLAPVPVETIARAALTHVRCTKHEPIYGDAPLARPRG